MPRRTITASAAVLVLLGLALVVARLTWGAGGTHPSATRVTASPPAPQQTSQTTATPGASPAGTPHPTPTSIRPTPTATSIPTPVPTPTPTPVPASRLAVRVSGNHLVNATGQPVRLLGVNRSGTEYTCVSGGGIFDGPTDDASVAAIASWHVNAIRVPMNEDCWLGINGVNSAYSGVNYQNAIVDWVNRLHRHNMYVILNLHFNAPGGQLATGQQPMADADHSPAFWQSVAATFRNDPAVLYDLYNEPHNISWSCLLNGCTSPGWQTAGMQSLVDAVRSAGAHQPLMIAGLDWSDDLSQWVQYLPSDPDRALVASYHSYNFNPQCALDCWNTTLIPIGQRYPIVTGELGEDDCGHTFIDQYMGWADAHGVSYLAWSWVTSDCSKEPALITDYNGAPTGFGIGLRDHLRAIN